MGQLVDRQGSGSGSGSGTGGSGSNSSSENKRPSPASAADNAANKKKQQKTQPLPSPEASDGGLAHMAGELDLESAASNAKTLAQMVSNSSSGLPTPRSSEFTPAGAGPIPQAAGSAAPHKYAAVSRQIHALFPRESVRRMLAHQSPSNDLLMFIFTDPHCLVDGKPQSLSSIVDVPPPTSHPALLARRLLQLAVLLQQMCCSVQREQLAADLAPRTIVDALAEWTCAVGELVTSSDELCGCLEGIECLVLLGILQSDGGQLRKAWMTCRRALNMAQLMGLDRGARAVAVAVRSCDPTIPFQDRSSSKLWWRINCGDRVLSLMLGLPMGCRDNSFSVPDPNDTPADRLMKTSAVLAGRLTDRNDITCSPTSAHEAYSATSALDLEAEQAASELDAAWWQIPDFAAAVTNRDAFAAAMMHLHAQVRHFTLLVLVHLPYLLRGRDDQRYVYNRAQCMAASRQVLERFLAFRGVVQSVVMGRFGDYAALVAAMTLLLGHLRPKPRDGVVPGSTGVSGVGKEEDRGADLLVVDKVHATMRELADINNDPLSAESADTILSLLPILRDNIVGESDAVRDVHLNIPFLGTVNINHQPHPPAASAVPGGGSSSSSQARMQTRAQVPSSTPSQFASVTTAEPSPFSQLVSHQPVSNPPVSNPPIPSFSDYIYLQQPQPVAPRTETQAGGGVHDDFPDPETMAAMSWPELTADLENWALQGVDTTYWTMLNNAIS